MCLFHCRSLTRFKTLIVIVINTTSVFKLSFFISNYVLLHVHHWNSNKNNNQNINEIPSTMKSEIQDEEQQELDPFRVTDINIIQYREDEELRRLKERKDNQNLKIWDKGCQHVNKSRAEWIKSLLSNDEEKNEIQNSSNVQGSDQNPSSSIVDKIEKYLANKGVQEKKESLPDFIAKKKELFLLQMSLNIKREEIEKLDEKTRLKEETLRKSEKILEEDALRFDVFLKENDKKAQEAWREAEKETKKKMEKIQDIKKLNQQLQIVQSTINKYKDNLEECLQYKAFLDQLTPKSWVEQQMKSKRERQRQRRRSRVERRRQEWKKEQEEKLASEQKALEETRAAANKNKRAKRRPRRKQNPDLEASVPKPELPPMPEFEDEPLTSSDEDIPMYFNKPQQVLEIFSSMEEENLFLIQNTQEAEQSLDEMSTRFQESKREVQQKVDTMQENINQLKSNINLKQEEIKTTTDHLYGKGTVSQRQDEDSMRDLTKKVKEVYHHCGFNDAGSTPRTLFMLSEIEASMEDILSRIATMPMNQFKIADKLKEKKRREAKRAQQQAEQARLQEERNRKVLERSMQPPKKPTGKKVCDIVAFGTMVHRHFFSPFTQQSAQLSPQ
jgi:AraC-like DNA-binding protein